MSATAEHFKELIAAAQEADQLEVTVPASQVQVLLDQLEVKSAAVTESALARMDEAIERWEQSASRQAAALTRLIEQNRVLQRKVAEGQTGAPQ